MVVTTQAILLFGKRRIRHRTTLKSNDLIFSRCWVNLEIQIQWLGSGVQTLDYLVIFQMGKRAVWQKRSNSPFKMRILNISEFFVNRKSRIHILISSNSVVNQFRIIGRKNDTNEISLNCQIKKNLIYNEATPTFHQWRYDGNVYG